MYFISSLSLNLAGLLRWLQSVKYIIALEALLVNRSILYKGVLRWQDFTYSGGRTQSISFTLTGIPNYQTLSVDNLAIVTAGLNPVNDAQTSQLRRSYNATTGVATLTTSRSSIYFDPAGAGVGVTLRVYWVEFE